MTAITGWLAATLLILAPAPAFAVDSEAVRAASEALHAGRRVGIEYLRTGNLDLAAMQLDTLAGAWRGARERLRAADDPELAQALAEAEQGLAQARAALDAGDATAARTRLEAATEALDAWRRAHGVRLYADCIREVNAAFAAVDALWRAPAKPIDETSTAALAKAAAATEHVLLRCAAEASAAIRDKAEFRRLVDGFAASLRLIPEALARRDRDYLHRLIIEQRSFDRLLAFRFG